MAPVLTVARDRAAAIASFLKIMTLPTSEGGRFGRAHRHARPRPALSTRIAHALGWMEKSTAANLRRNRKIDGALSLRRN
jgi:hypothetical protein